MISSALPKSMPSSISESGFGFDITRQGRMSLRRNKPAPRACCICAAKIDALFRI